MLTLELFSLIKCRADGLNSFVRHEEFCLQLWPRLHWTEALYLGKYTFWTLLVVIHNTEKQLFLTKLACSFLFWLPHIHQVCSYFFPIIRLLAQLFQNQVLFVQEWSRRFHNEDRNHLYSFSVGPESTIQVLIWLVSVSFIMLDFAKNVLASHTKVLTCSREQPSATKRLYELHLLSN